MSWRIKLRAALKAKGYTLDSIGQETGVTESAVGHWLSGRREPSITALKKMAEMAGMNLTELFGDGGRFLVVNDDEIEIIEALRKIPKGQRQLAVRLLEQLNISDDPPSKPVRGARK